MEKTAIKPKWYQSIYDKDTLTLNGKECWFSNVKFILILLVVMGHFTFYAEDKSAIVHGIRDFLHIFHMPAFVFITGYFSKSCAKSFEKNTNKVLSMTILYLITQCIWYFARVLTRNGGKMPEFTLLSPDTGLWYLAFVAGATLLLPVFSRFRPQLIMLLLVLAGLYIGIEDEASKYMNVSRFVVFMPFFMAGFLFKKEYLLMLKNKWVKLSSGLFMISLLAYSFFFETKFVSDITKAGESFEKVKVSNVDGLILRAFVFIVAFLATMALFSLIPRGKTFFTKFGNRTLQVYLFHLLLYVVLSRTGVLKAVSYSVNEIVLFAGIIALTFILSLKPFSYPFSFVSKIKFREHKQV